jgi:hypothetical protein
LGKLMNGVQNRADHHRADGPVFGNHGHERQVMKTFWRWSLRVFISSTSQIIQAF